MKYEQDGNGNIALGRYPLPGEFFAYKVNAQPLARKGVLQCLFIVLVVAGVAAFAILLPYFLTQDKVQVTTISNTILPGHSCTILSAVPARTISYSCQDAGSTTPVLCSQGTAFGADLYTDPGPGGLPTPARLSKLTVDHPPQFFEMPSECQSAWEPDGKLCAVPNIDDRRVRITGLRDRERFVINVPGGSSTRPGLSLYKNIAYIGTSIGWVMAFDMLAGGNLVWSTILPGNPGRCRQQVEVSHEHGLVLVLTDTEGASPSKPTLSALRENDGAIQWQSPVASRPTHRQGPVLSGSMYNSATLVYVAVFRTVEAFNITTGDLVWTFNVPVSHLEGPAYLDPDGNVLVGTYGGHIFKIASQNGAQLWTQRVAMTAIHGLAIDHAGVVAGATSNVTMMSLDSGSVVWSRPRTCAMPRFDDVAGIRGNMLFCYNEPNSQVFALFRSSGQTAWEQSFSHRATALTLGLDGSLFIGTRSSLLIALAPDSGLVKWQYLCTADVITHAAVLDDDSVIFGIGGDQVHTIRTDDGSFLWEYRADRITGPATLNEDPEAKQVYFGTTGDSTIHVLRTADFLPLRKVNTSPTHPTTALTLSRSRQIVYFAFRNGDLVAVNTSATQGVIWSKSMIHPPTVRARPALSPGEETVYMVSSDVGQTLEAYDAVNGNFKWMFSTQGTILETPLVLSTGAIFLCDSSARVYKINGIGALIWQQIGTAAFVGVTACSPDEETLYVSDVTGVLHAIDADSGTPVWTFDTSTLASFDTSVAVASNGNLFFVHQATIYSLDSLGNLRWTYPLQASCPGRPAFTNDEERIVVLCSPIISNPDSIEAVLAPHPVVKELYTSDGRLAWTMTLPHGGVSSTSAPITAASGMVYLNAGTYAYAYMHRGFTFASARCVVSGLALPQTSAAVDLANAAVILPADTLEGCLSLWQQRFCNASGSPTAKHMRDAYCRAFDNHPPYTCTREETRGILEALSLTFSFAELLYVTLLFLMARGLWHFHGSDKQSGSGPQVLPASTEAGNMPLTRITQRMEPTPTATLVLNPKYGFADEFDQEVT